MYLKVSKADSKHTLMVKSPHDLDACLWTSGRPLGFTTGALYPSSLTLDCLASIWPKQLGVTCVFITSFTLRATPYKIAKKKFIRT